MIEKDEITYGKKIFKMILFLIVFLMLCNNSICFAEGYIWSDYEVEELLDVSTGVDLELESGGAILIEQTTRYNFI